MGEIVRKPVLGRLRFAACAAALLVMPASADIGAYNAAVKAGDYKKAAAEAAATWPTLDQSRADIALIAREFGFVSFVAGDFAAAQTFAQTAVTKQTGDAAAADELLVSAVLLNLASHKAKPSAATRDKLFEALSARAAKPGLDNISYLGTEALVAFDFDKGRWKEAQASAHLAADMTAKGGVTFLINRRRYQLFAGIADYMATKKPETRDDLLALQEAIMGDMQAVGSEVAATKFKSLYWEVNAWSDSMRSHLVAQGKFKPSSKTLVELLADQERIRSAYPLAQQILHQHDDGNTCRRTLKVKQLPQYPPSALYKGFVGTVILQVDLDAEGKLNNPVILAAVPEKDFAKSVLKSFDGVRYEPGPGWDASKCSLAHKAHTIIFNFMIPPF